MKPKFIEYSLEFLGTIVTVPYEMKQKNKKNSW